MNEAPVKVYITSSVDPTFPDGHFYACYIADAETRREYYAKYSKVHTIKVLKSDVLLWRLITEMQEDWCKATYLRALYNRCTTTKACDKWCETHLFGIEKTMHYVAGVELRLGGAAFASELYVQAMYEVQVWWMEHNKKVRRI